MAALLRHGTTEPDVIEAATGSGVELYGLAGSITRRPHARVC
jgi:hypothetical protein